MVLQLSTFHWEGGAGVAAARLHQALLKSGIESNLLVPQLSNPQEHAHAIANTKWQSRKAWGRFVAERLHFLPFEKDSTVRFAFSPAQSGVDISEHPLVQAASIIHLHWINFGFLSLKSLERLFLLGKPIVWTLHDMWAATGGCHYSRGCDHYLSHCRYCPYLRKPEQYDISFSQFETKKSIYQNANITLVSPSRWLNEIVLKAALTGHLSSLSIPNCIDTDLFKLTGSAEARKALGLPSGKKLLLFAGANTQDPRKGFLYLKKALEGFNAASHDVEVLILGKGNAQKFEDMPVKTHYLGKITDPARMVSAYNAADMIIVPSLEDNLPNTIMEAMACGTPAVGFATGGIPEMIGHRQNGYVAEATSASSLADGIRWILENNTENAVSQQARQKVIEHYSEKVVAAQYSKLYRSLLHE